MKSSLFFFAHIRSSSTLFLHALHFVARPFSIFVPLVTILISILSLAFLMNTSAVSRPSDFSTSSSVPFGFPFFHAPFASLAAAIKGWHNARYSLSPARNHVPAPKNDLDATNTSIASLLFFERNCFYPLGSFLFLAL